MDAAVVELDPLTDAVGTAAQNDGLLFACGCDFILSTCFVCRVHVRRLRRKFGGTGIDALEDGCDMGLDPGLANVGGRLAGKLGNSGVGEAHLLDFEPAVRLSGKVFADNRFLVDDGLDAFKEPRVVFAGGVDVLDRKAVAEGLRHDQKAVGAWLGQGCMDVLGVDFIVVALITDGAGQTYFFQAIESRFKCAKGLLQRFLKAAANRHDLAHRFHRGGEAVVRAAEFFKVKAWNLGHNIIDAGFKRRGRRSGDVVFKLVQRIAHGQFGGDLGNREARGFGRKR